MPQIQNEVSVPANSSISNVLAGATYEFLPWNASLQFGLVAAATGLVCTVQSGSDVLLEESPISTLNRFPIFPDDYTLDDVAGQGEQLKVVVRNTTGAPIIFFYGVRLFPLGG